MNMIPNEEDKFFTGRTVLTERERYSRLISNPVGGDKISPQRIVEPFDADAVLISSYAQFNQIPQPSSPATGGIRLYTKSTGLDTKLYILNNLGVEKELLSTATITLENAYINGSVVDVDSTDVEWRIDAFDFAITNSTGLTDYLRVDETGVKIFDYTLPLTDGIPDQVLSTDGAGQVSFTSIGTIGDTTYLRLDGTNSPITGNVLVDTTNQIQFRDTDISISSLVDGDLDIDADVNINFRTGGVNVVDGNFNVALGNLTVTTGGITTGADVIVGGRIQGKKGIDVPSASTITFGQGNYFDITGTTTINHITTTNWQAGSEVTVKFDASVTVTHNAAAPPIGTAAIYLSGSINFSATIEDTLTVVFDGVVWREKCRSVI